MERSGREKKKEEKIDSRMDSVELIPNIENKLSDVYLVYYSFQNLLQQIPKEAKKSLKNEK
jgi:hypothetical protein